jgi:hypothetical protein
MVSSKVVFIESTGSSGDQESFPKFSWTFSGFSETSDFLSKTSISGDEKGTKRM